MRKPAVVPTQPLGTRAVLRGIEPGGSWPECPRCELRIKFRAIKRLRQVVANIYEDDRWVRVEHFHEACYLAAGEPYGVADSTGIRRHG